MIENPLTIQLKPYRILLASGSPRRQQYLKELGISFEIVKNPVDEIYPEKLVGEEISNYLAKLKAEALGDELREKDILITADTVVWHKGISLAKPANVHEAVQMLSLLSDDWHEVITSVCFTTVKEQRVVSSTTRVRFRKLIQEEIRFYVENYQPTDKAGAYGIQEWLGLIAIVDIKGSYSNVVGLPTTEFYSTLKKLAK